MRNVVVDTAARLGLVVFVAACAANIGTEGPGPTGPPVTSALAPTPTADETAAAPSPGSTQSTLGPLTDAELLAITAGGLVPIPADAPAPKIDAATAEATVRATYRGERQTIDVRRIAIKLANGVRVGWEVALTPAAGAPCNFHPGLLERAIEGGIVDDQTGDMFWTGTCF